MTSMFEPNPAAQALEAARDEVARLFTVANMIDREHVLAILRRHLDAVTPEPPP